MGIRLFQIFVCGLLVLYLGMLTRQILVYGDVSNIIFKWLYYLIFISFMEELEYRAVIPALLKGHVNSKLEWILPNVLFACAHVLMPMVQGKSAGDIFNPDEFMKIINDFMEKQEL